MNTITVTEKTTLGELLAILDLAEKSGKTPTPQELFEGTKQERTRQFLQNYQR